MSVALVALGCGFIWLAHMARRRGDWFMVGINLFVFANLVYAIAHL